MNSAPNITHLRVECEALIHFQHKLYEVAIDVDCIAMLQIIDEKLALKICTRKTLSLIRC